MPKDTCRNGHPLVPENIYTEPNGKRKCRECGRERVRRYRERQPKVPLKPSGPKPTVPYERVLRMARIEADGCWIFTGKLTPQGYASVSVPKGRSKGSPRLGHRVVYEALKGPIPEGYHLHHLCERPACVNPDHLHPMTASDHLKLHARRPRPSRRTLPRR